MENPNYRNTHPSTHPASSPGRVGIGTAHSKIILMGEHAVVYDHPAIALPFPAANATVTIRPGRFEGSTLQSRYYQGKISEAPAALHNLLQAIQATQLTFKLPSEPLDIMIESTIPSGRGMGSSAAVSVALVRALASYYHCPLSDYQLHFLVNQAEVIAHESPSGLDTLITSINHPVIYRKSAAPVPFSLHLPAYLIVADSNMEGQTREAILKVRALLDSNTYFIKTAMQAIGDFVYQAIDAIKDKDIVELGRLMTYNHYYLNQLDISNAQLDRIINAAWVAGALGAKLTGGGLGGCVIALSATQDQANRIEQAMQSAGAVQTWQLDLNTI